MEKYFHVPVMIEEVISFLDIKKNGYYIDGTLGGGGYTNAISEKIGNEGRVIAIDLDPLAVNNFLDKKPDNVIIFNDNFANIEKIIKDNKNVILKDKFDGIVLDLGLSSAQLSDINRGFSFSQDNVLDMSFGPKIENDTFQIVNYYNFKDLERVIKEYGEEPWAKKIVEYIIEARKKQKITTTFQLSEIIARAIPRKFWSKKIHPATKTFQALRIETNKELDNLKKFLPSALALLKKGGRLVIVSFHSLEDRIVKNFFRDLSKGDNPTLKILTKKPLIPSDDEIKKNFRSRSAKLRAIEKN